MRRRSVVAHYDYLDGTQGLFVTKPEEFHEHVRRVPVKLLDALEKARTKAASIEAEIMGYPEVRNRKFKPEEEEAS